MRPLVTYWPYGLVYIAVFLWAYLPEMILNRRSRGLLRSQDAGSFRVVMLLQGLAMFAGFSIAFTGAPGMLARQRLWYGLGLGAMIAGRALRLHCFRILGQSFTAIVVVKPEQQVVEGGAYRWVRHPSYTAGILMLTGAMLALGNWLSVAVVLSAAIWPLL